MTTHGFGGLHSTPLREKTLMSCPVRAVGSLVVLVFLWTLPPGAAAQQMKLLTRDTGWVSSGNKILYWTSDGGDTWTDITPRVPDGRLVGELRAVFFLDTQQGWAVISYEKHEGTATIQQFLRTTTVYEIAQTVDSGRTWSHAPLAYPELPQWIQDTFAGPKGLYFLDSSHGWLDVGFEGNAHPGKLLATEDGGRMWNWVNSPGLSGPIRFHSTEDGWLVGGWASEGLYSTHDGCKTWKEVVLVPPPQVRGESYRPVIDDPPVFEGSRRGLVAVHYLGPEDTQSKLVVYSSADGGRVWSPGRVLPESQQGGSLAIAITESAIVVPTGSSPSQAGVARVPLAGETTSEVVVSDASATALTFADSTSGWLLSTDGRLVATEDGGSTWKVITPWHVFNLAPAPQTPSPKLPAKEAKPAATSSPGTP
jgi:photosystem II stability/assembly factor-like uncharacterized protein